jgi:hypothetical protein
MKNNTIQLKSFDTFLGLKCTKTQLTYNTLVGTAKITVTYNDNSMSTGNFYFSVKKDNLSDAKFNKTEKIVTDEAIAFVEKLKDFLLYG